MPTWRNDLPNEQKHMGFQLQRTPAAGALQAIITCDDLLVCDTHFWHGRTVPCERPVADHPSADCRGSCPACAEAIPFRTHVYVSAFDGRKHEHFIFECTTHAAKPLADYRQANRTLRGCSFYANRPKGQKNSRVVIETNTVNLTKINLPQPPNITLALGVIWRLPAAALAAAADSRYRNRISADHRAIDAALRQPDNQPDPPTIQDILDGNGQRLNLPSTP
jgi:hypothetical protein